MKLLKRLDTAAATIVLTGAAATTIAGLVQDRTDEQPRPAVAGGYAVLGVATAYSIFRLLGPKSRREHHLSRLAAWYDQADSYQRRLQTYRQTADTLLKRLNSWRKDS